MVNIWNECGRMKSLNNLTNGIYFLPLKEIMKDVSECSVIETRFETRIFKYPVVINCPKNRKTTKQNSS